MAKGVKRVTTQFTKKNSDGSVSSVNSKIVEVINSKTRGMKKRNNSQWNNFVSSLLSRYQDTGVSSLIEIAKSPIVRRAFSFLIPTLYERSDLNFYMLASNVKEDVRDNEKYFEKIFFKEIFPINRLVFSICWSIFTLGYVMLRKVREEDYKDLVTGKMIRGKLVKLEIVSPDDKTLKFALGSDGTLEEVYQTINGRDVELVSDDYVYITCGEYSTDFTTPISFVTTLIKSVTNVSNIEDMLLLFRNTRAPLHLLWKVWVGGMNPQDAEAYIDNFSSELNRDNFYNPGTGAYDQTQLQKSVVNDYYVPKTPAGETTLETVDTSFNTGELPDLDHFTNNAKLASGLPGAVWETEQSSDQYISSAKLDMTTNQIFNILKKNLTNFQEAMTEVFIDYLIENKFARYLVDDIRVAFTSILRHDEVVDMDVATAIVEAIEKINPDMKLAVLERVGLLRFAESVTTNPEEEQEIEYDEDNIDENSDSEANEGNESTERETAEEKPSPDSTRNEDEEGTTMMNEMLNDTGESGDVIDKKIIVPKSKKNKNKNFSRKVAQGEYEKPDGFESQRAFILKTIADLPDDASDSLLKEARRTVGESAPDFLAEYDDLMKSGSFKKKICHDSIKNPEK